MRQGTELRCIASTDGAVSLTSAVSRHMMTALPTKLNENYGDESELSKLGHILAL